MNLPRETGLGGIAQNGGDLILERHTFAPQFGDMLITHWFDIGLGPVYVAVHGVVIIGQFRKMRIRLFQSADLVGVFGEIFDKFMWCMGHVPPPEFDWDQGATKGLRLP